jgi:hypothetical protein
MQRPSRVESQGRNLGEDSTVLAGTVGTKKTCPLLML